MTPTAPLAPLPPRARRARRRTLLSGASAVSASLAAVVASLAATPAAGAVPPRPPQDRLTVTVTDSGVPGRDGTYALTCHPAGGDHPERQAACEALDRATVWGREPFAEVPEDAHCTLQYGGPATAHVTGTWGGRPVDAEFRRTDGCEVSRWDRLVPFLPRTRS
ncbi:SSI family serine proteinase inhibitor [Streptomyces sp. JJ36]|uniref:SSI family serine proteinase inhibitor n=1 Tax=Streptomyces sp. JJ36 TaxID=2736645 RepID=UPI001F2AE44D|nr:SSI family serine proteinase inhibitor [Streptomyces sp. JJ36]MCF6524822.1 hypothetical protein [Streptomyces sp. JJ36]